MGKNSQPRHPRQRIIDLSTALRLNYKPLVNEKTKEVDAFEILPGREGHTRDQLIMLATAALADVSDFIKKYEEMKDNYENLTADAMMAYVEGKSRGIEAGSLAELAESLGSKFDQACDVIRKIGDISHDSDVQTITSKFLSRFVIEQGEVDKPNRDILGDGAAPPEAPSSPAE